MTWKTYPFGESGRAWTIQAASDWIEENSGKGCICPCCGQKAKLYRVPMSGGAVASFLNLVRLYREDHEWHHILKFMAVPNQGGRFATLAYWGLIEEKPNPDNPNKRTSGWWRPTPKGLRFAEGALRLPAAVFTYNARLIGIDTENDVDVSEALGKKFSYVEIMGYAAIPIEEKEVGYEDQ